MRVGDRALHAAARQTLPALVSVLRHAQHTSGEPKIVATVLLLSGSCVHHGHCRLPKRQRYWVHRTPTYGAC